MLQPVVSNYTVKSCADRLPVEPCKQLGYNAAVRVGCRSRLSNQASKPGCESLSANCLTLHAQLLAYPAAPVDKRGWSRLFSGDRVGLEAIFVETGQSSAITSARSARKPCGTSNCVETRTVECLTGRVYRTARSATAIPSCIALSVHADSHSLTVRFIDRLVCSHVVRCNEYKPQRALHMYVGYLNSAGILVPYSGYQTS